MANAEEHDRFNRLMNVANQMSEEDAEKASDQISQRFKGILANMDLEGAAQMHPAEHDDMAVILSCMMVPLAALRDKGLSGEAYADMLIDIMSLTSEIWILSKAYYSELPRTHQGAAL